MKRVTFVAGKGLQALALVLLPAAIWETQIRSSEPAALGVLLLSVVLFWGGTALSRFG